MSALKSIFNGIVDDFQQNPIGYIGESVNNLSNLFAGVKNFGNSSNTGNIPVSGSGFMPSGTVTIPTGNGQVVIQSQPQSSGFGIDTSNPVVLIVGVVLIGKLLKIF